SGDLLERAQLEQLWRGPGLTPDQRIAARFLSDKSNFAALANASTHGTEHYVTRADVQARRPTLTSLLARVKAEPTRKPSSTEQAAYGAALEKLRETAARYASQALPWIESQRRQLETAITAVREKDGIADEHAEQ